MEQNTVVDKKIKKRCSAWSNDAKDKMEHHTVVNKTTTRCSAWSNDAKDKMEHHTVALGVVTSLKNCRTACGSTASTSVQNKTTAIFISFQFITFLAQQFRQIQYCNAL